MPEVSTVGGFPRFPRDVILRPDPPSRSRSRRLGTPDDCFHDGIRIGEAGKSQAWGLTDVARTIVAAPARGLPVGVRRFSGKGVVGPIRR